MLPKVKGSHPWAVILGHASDQVVPAVPPLNYFSDLVASASANGLYTWWQQISDGNLDFEGSTVFGWYGLPYTLAQLSGMSRDQIVAAVRAAATIAGANVSGYLHTLGIVTGYPGGGNVGSDVVSGITATNGQPGWRWCSQCQGIAFWDGSRPPGPCITGTRHDHSGSSYYALPQDTRFVNGQDNWRWCKKCETLIYRTATPAPCPAGGPHALGSSADYVLRNNSTAPNEQQNWHWCNKCQALAYYDGSGLPGPCSVGGRHDHTGSGNYSIPYAWTASLGFLAHETGHGFGLDHAFGTARTGDFYNDNRPGAYGDWTDVMSWAGTAGFATPRFTPAGAGLSAPTLDKLGWLSGSDVATILPPAVGQTLALKPLYGGAPGSTPRMIRVIEPTQGWIYTAEYRMPLSWDQGIQTGRVVIHAMRTLYQAGQDGWRWCAACEGLIYAGVTACPAGGLHDGSVSADYCLSFDPAAAGQHNWRWCDKCSGLFFAGNPSQGACPAGGSHDGTRSADYALPSSGIGQSNWQWCNQCQGLAFAGNGTPGVCPAGGPHNHGGSAAYVLDTSAGANLQNKWRWCNKCQGLYYAGMGACKGGDVHKPVGEDYGPVHDLTGAAGQSGWRYCNKCFGLAFNDGSRPPGACAAGGTHDHSTSGQYVIPRDAEAESGQRQWHACSNCSALNYVDTSRGPGLCSAGGTHNPGGEYLVAHDTNAVTGQSGFHWCRRCENMVFGNNPAKCMAGGHHDTSGSANYIVRVDPAPLMREQAYWRVCTKCSALFALNTPDGSNEKPCAGGGKHSASGEYFVTYVTPNPYWRWCRNCESLAFWDGSRAPGPCPAGGSHDHSASGFYIPPSFLLDVTQVVNDNLLAGGSWRDPSDHVRFEVLTVDPSRATVRVTAT